jgi:hypothetical protein
MARFFSRHDPVLERFVVGVFVYDRPVALFPLTVVSTAPYEPEAMCETRRQVTVMSRIWGVAEDRRAGCRQGGASVMRRLAPAKW